MDLELIKQFAGSLLRQLLTPVVAFLASSGYISDDQATNLSVILASLLVSVALSFINKYFLQKKVEVALELPKGSSKEDLAKQLKLR